MNMEMIVIIGLCVLLVIQQVFFFHQIEKFTDKLMAGTYTNYVQNKAVLNESLKAKDGFSIQLPQDGAPDELDQLNALMTQPF